MDEFYIVAARPASGGLPKLCKADLDRLFFSRSDAEHQARISADLYQGKVRFSVYRCEGEVKEEVKGGRD
jgi:hypothetical protein